MNPYIAYYENQAGGGHMDKYNNFGRVYVGAPYQRGHGIGAFLGGLFRRILPYFGSAARAVGKEALSAGFNVIGDVTNRVPFKVSLENRLSESGLNLKRKAADKLNSMMSGSGYKRKRRRRGGYKHLGRGSSNTSASKKKKKAKLSRDKKPKRRASKRKTRDIYDIFN